MLSLPSSNCVCVDNVVVPSCRCAVCSLLDCCCCFAIDVFGASAFDNASGQITQKMTRVELEQTIVFRHQSKFIVLRHCCMISFDCALVKPNFLGCELGRCLIVGLIRIVWHVVKVSKERLN